MTTLTIDPELDLTLHRLIRAPRREVWRAWTEPSLLEQWWIPAPLLARVEVLDVSPGGGLVTAMSEDGRDYVPHMDCVFLLVEEGRRLVYTNAVTSSWRPARPQPVAMSAEISLDDHPDGTAYRIVVRHGDPADRARHEELGFLDGWGAVADALAKLVEDGSATA